jgi:rubrerythrin
MEQSTSYSDGVLAAICSNLAKACEKQLKNEESVLFSQLSRYHMGRIAHLESKDFSDLSPMIADDIAKKYAAVENEATLVKDRGALRCVTWGKKVTAIHKSLLARFETQGDALLDGNQVYVCEACGFIAVASDVPQLCPICKAPASRFVKIS